MMDDNPILTQLKEYGITSVKVIKKEYTTSVMITHETGAYVKVTALHAPIPILKDRWIMLGYLTFKLPNMKKRKVTI